MTSQSKPFTPLDTKAISSATHSITDLPWKANPDGKITSNVNKPVATMNTQRILWYQEADFIVNAPNYIDTLLGEITRQGEYIKSLEQQVNDQKNSIGS